MHTDTYTHKGTYTQAHTHIPRHTDRQTQRYKQLFNLEWWVDNQGIVGYYCNCHKSYLKTLVNCSTLVATLQIKSQLSLGTQVMMN